MRIGRPEDAFQLVNALCWAAGMLVWAVSAFFVKRTVERSRETGWLGALLLLFVLFGIVRRIADLQQPLWPRSTALEALGNLLTMAGLAVTLWARAVLGRNWSGTVVFKEDHELIQRGPYAYVRHPIYSGFLLMGLGTAVTYGRLAGFVLLAAGMMVFAVKSRAEERLMTSHFPEAYPEYRRRVKALIPGVW